MAKETGKPTASNDRRLQPKTDEAGLTRWAREDDDVKLMLRFQKGEHEAFEELVNQIGRASCRERV